MTSPGEVTKLGLGPHPLCRAHAKLCNNLVEEAIQSPASPILLSSALQLSSWGPGHPNCIYRGLSPAPRLWLYRPFTEGLIHPHQYEFIILNFYYFVYMCGYVPSRGQQANLELTLLPSGSQDQTQIVKRVSSFTH